MFLACKSVHGNHLSRLFPIRYDNRQLTFWADSLQSYYLFAVLLKENSTIFNMIHHFSKRICSGFQVLNHITINPCHINE